MTSVSGKTWQTLQIKGVQRIERVVAEFYIECGDISNRFFRVKITEDSHGNYIGRLNVSLRNSKTGFPEWTVGLGSSVEVALEDAVQTLMQQLLRAKHDRSTLSEEDFEWADCEDF